MRPSLTVLTLAPILAVGVGCVPQDRYDNLLTANRSLKEQLAVVEADRDQARNGLRSVQDQLTDTSMAYNALQRKYGDLETSVEGLGSSNDEYLRRIAMLELGPLPVEMESAIENLAMAHPEVLTFDRAQGMVRFSSDFTFDLGSTELKGDAAKTIAALASILNEPVALGLEARIVGHTDNVPIGRPETRRLHPTNTHLSVHRAIAVRDALREAGVDGTRLQVAGYGEYRPVVENNGNRGAAANRRVEIFFAPMPEHGMAAQTPSSDATKAPQRSTSAEPNK